MAHDEERYCYEFGPFCLDAGQKLLLRAARIVPLTLKAYETLLVLVRNAGQFVSKERLLAEVWADSNVEENVVAVNISTLRRALGEQTDARPYIENSPKRGYRVSADVRKVRCAEAADAAVSLAILPFANASDDPQAEYLSDGITESIINILSPLRRLRVIARSVVFRYKGQPVDPQQAGRELAVQTVLMGQVLRLGARLVIRTELVDVADGRQLWGAQYDRQAADLLAVQEEIAMEIANRLKLQLSLAERQQLSKRYTEDTVAHDRYLLGRFFWNKRTPESLAKAIDYFQQASTRDPNYSVAYSGLADCYTLLHYYSALRPTDAMPQAQAAAEQALRIEPTLAEAYASRGIVRFWYEWDWVGAESDFKQSLALNPAYATAHQWYCWYLVALRRFDEALAVGARSLQLDPLALPVNAALGKAYFFAGRYDEALAQCQKTLEMDAHFIPALHFGGRAYEQKGLHREALRLHTQAGKLSGDLPLATAILAHTHARAGHTDEARRLLDSLLTLHAQSRRYVPAYGLALAYAALDDDDQAFAWLERACAERFFWLVYLDVDPSFDRLRRDPRFAALRRRIGLPD